VPVRFLTRKQVAEELNISMAQCYALIRRGELRAAKIGVGVVSIWSRYERRRDCTRRKRRYPCKPHESPRKARET